MRILIVEDEQTNRMILDRILTSYGEVTLCEDGQEALDAFTKAHSDGYPYDLVCMDFMLPNMDGRDTVARIRDMESSMGIAMPNKVKILMITGLSSLESEYGDISSLSDAVLQKPFKKSEVEEIVERMGFAKKGS
ncbi:MAG TPA: response regulator [Deltaproteobacteria bacterium]|nr:response regulator [Deltaproteobacteria bacterium]HPP80977.1 response regulator [Deltaproteobacteria bacterium]